MNEIKNLTEVICLCADWCGTCREYQAGFMALAEQFKDTPFRWVDIEEEANELGDIDVENFPTLLIRQGEHILFFGVMLPHLSHLQKILENFLKMPKKEVERYIQATPERILWQKDPILARIGRSSGNLSPLFHH